MLITNQGSNDISVLFGSYDANGDWIASIGPRLRTGGAGPIAVTVSDLAGNANPDLIVTNGGSGTETVLPGVGQGFFNDQQPKTLFQFGASLIQAPTFVGDTGLGYALTDAGNLMRFDLDNPAAGAVLVYDKGDVVAARALANGDVVAAVADGSVEVLDPQGGRLVVGAELQAQTGTPLSPSSLVVLQKAGGQLEVLVSSQGSDTIFAYASGAGSRSGPVAESGQASSASLPAIDFFYSTALPVTYALGSGAGEGAAAAGASSAVVAAVTVAAPSVTTFTSLENLGIAADTSAVLVPVQGNAYSTVAVLGLGTLNNVERGDGAGRNPALSVGRSFGDTSPLTRFVIGQDDALNQHRGSTGTRLGVPGRDAADPWRADLFFRSRPWQPPIVGPMDEDEMDDDGPAALPDAEPDFWNDGLLDRPLDQVRSGPDLGVTALLIAAGLLSAAPLIAAKPAPDETGWTIPLRRRARK
jgi:hypothetical protein